MEISREIMRCRLEITNWVKNSGEIRKFGTLRIEGYFFIFYFYFSHTFTFQLLDNLNTVVTGVVPSPLRFLPSIFIAHRVQQSHCSSIFHRVLLTHALALSAIRSICAQERVPTNLYECALWGIRTHETDLYKYQARG